MEEKQTKERYELLSEIVKVAVLGWSAALLTLSYMGFFQKMDPTFIASVFSGSLAGYGISKATESRSAKKPTIEEPTQPLKQK